MEKGRGAVNCAAKGSFLLYKVTFYSGYLQENLFVGIRKKRKNSIKKIEFSNAEVKKFEKGKTIKN